MKWQKKITKKEMKHLKKWCTGNVTLTGISRTFAAQAKTRAENNNDPALEPCWECKWIANKLGFEV